MPTSPNARPSIKFCGICSPDDLEAVNEIAPDYIGFVFFEKSKRKVSADEARALRAGINGKIQTVGVFVDAEPAFIARLFEEKTIQIAQLHGNEDDRYIEELRVLAPKLEIWQAFEIKCAADIEAANASKAEFVLLDGGKGEGHTFDWALLAKVVRPFGLAGGMSVENVGPALMNCRPSLVDVSSGIESSLTDAQGKPRKSRALMQSFLRMVEQNAAPMQAPKQTPKKGKHMAENTAPQTNGRFGVHGGQYIPETLMNAVIELEEAYEHYKNDPEFKAELKDLLDNYANRPSLLYYAEKMTRDLGGCKIYLKREDLNHTGAHKINNALGQALLAKKMGKTRLIAETGAGQHGVATATVAALLNMECHVYMGIEDMERQALNVYRMRLMGAEVHGVDSGTGTLKDAVSECMREWTNRIDDTHYLLGSCMGPHPFPTIVRDFQSFIGYEIIDQCTEKEGRLPDYVLACVGGGSNAIGTFYPFIEHEGTALIGCEAAGRGIDTFETAATINTGSLGIFHGMKSYFCQDEYGQIAPVYSISAGLDYPGIGPEHAWLNDTGRAQYVAITDDEAVDAFEYLSRTEGIIPAIESAHALAYAMKIAPTLPKDKIMVITLSGRGDKDCVAMARYRGQDISE